jgi:hypothetical protein
MLKLKDVLKESEEFGKLPNEIKKHFLEIISTYGNHRESITRKSDIREIAETLGAIADAAQEYTLREGGDWFDRVTIKRNMKELKGLCEKFEKESSLAKDQEQRLEALYEDMGHVLSRYFEIAEVSEAMMRERLGIKQPISINEGDWSKIMKAVKKGGGDSFTLVVFDKNNKNKVVFQKTLPTIQKDLIPAYYEDIKRKYKGPSYMMGIEDGEGKMVYTQTLKESAPEGWEKTVKAMKDEPGVDNPWALAHWMKGKGYKSHK